MRFRKNNNLNDWQKYKSLRAEYQEQLDEAEKKHKMKITSSLASKRNSKGWWSAVKCLIGRGGNVSYPALNAGDKFITNNKDKASVFNKFFLSHSTIDTTKAHLRSLSKVLLQWQMC